MIVLFSVLYWLLKGWNKSENLILLLLLFIFQEVYRKIIAKKKNYTQLKIMHESKASYHQRNIYKLFYIDCVILFKHDKCCHILCKLWLSLMDLKRLCKICTPLILSLQYLLLDDTVFSPSVRLFCILFVVENLLILTDFYNIKWVSTKSGKDSRINM